MNKAGILVKIEDNAAVIMTGDFKYYRIKSKPYMIVGQEYEFGNRDIILPKNQSVRFVPIAATIAASVLFMVLYFNFFLKSPICAYIDLDINPSIELAVDSKNEVIETKAINNDAVKILEDIDLKGKSLSDSIVLIIRNSVKMGYIKDTSSGNAVIAASLKNEAGNTYILDSVLKECDRAIKETAIKIDTRYMKVDKSSREQAVSNNISMGRYVIYMESQKKGSKITIEEAKNKPLSEIIKEVQPENSNQNTVNSNSNKVLPSSTPAKAGYSVVDISALAVDTPTPAAVKKTPGPILKETSSNAGGSRNVSEHLQPVFTSIVSDNFIIPFNTPEPTLNSIKNDPISTPEIKQSDKPYYFVTFEPIKEYTPYPVMEYTPQPVIEFTKEPEKINTPTPTKSHTISKNYDVNNDGILNEKDMDMIKYYIGLQVYASTYDLNGDGNLDYKDYDILRNAVSLNSKPTPVPTQSTSNFSKYDVNMDGNIDGKDLSMVKFYMDNFAYDKKVDFNGDGVIDDKDYYILKDSIPYTSSTTYTSSTPIPNYGTPAKPYLSQYDFNKDGILDDNDLITINSAIKYNKYDPSMDLNKDGILDNNDYGLAKKNIVN